MRLTLKANAHIAKEMQVLAITMANTIPLVILSELFSEHNGTKCVQ